MAEFYSRLRQWFRDRIESGPAYQVEQARQRILKYGGRDLSQRELDLTYVRLQREGLVP